MAEAIPGIRKDKHADDLPAQYGSHDTSDSLWKNDTASLETKIYQQYQFTLDPLQKKLVQAFERALMHLRSHSGDLPNQSIRQYLSQRLSRFISKLTGVLHCDTATHSLGFYIWGTVGRGKTFLTQAFLDAMPDIEQKVWHYNHFMRMLHEGMRAEDKGDNPLDSIAAEVAQDYRVIFIDEMFVIDIGDAMLMRGILQGLFDRGVFVITTSNFPPDDLYKNGLQRESFVPAIKLMKHHMQIMNLSDGDYQTDYRRQLLASATAYHTPLSDDATSKMERLFSALSAHESQSSERAITILKRDIPLKVRTETAIWFEFEQICRTNRSARDYISIADQFQIVFISSIPKMDDAEMDVVRRFISLIDEMYYSQIKLFVSAACDVDSLYGGHRLANEFQRTRSRLMEMQSHDYLDSSPKESLSVNTTN